jgi:hypothetical protein
MAPLNSTPILVSFPPSPETAKFVFIGGNALWLGGMRSGYAKDPYDRHVPPTHRGMANTLVVTASPSTTYGFEGPHEQQPLATHLWTQEDVQVWLFESGVGDCASYFAAKKVDGRALLKLRPVDLGAELGLKDEEAQLRVCAALSPLKERSRSSFSDGTPPANIGDGADEVSELRRQLVEAHAKIAQLEQQQEVYYWQGWADAEVEHGVEQGRIPRSALR